MYDGIVFLFNRVDIGNKNEIIEERIFSGF